jgi:predicted DNA-binding protein
MSQVVSTRLPDHTAERLKRFARQLGKTPSETSAILIEESLRESFPILNFAILLWGDNPTSKTLI